MSEIISLLLSSGSFAKGNRSSALRPLTIPISALVIALGVVLKLGNPIAVYITLFLFVLTIFIFLGVFIYFSIKNPDLLRSEKFQLEKIQ